MCSSSTLSIGRRATDVHKVDRSDSTAEGPFAGDQVRSRRMRFQTAVVAIAFAPGIVAGQQVPPAGPAVDPNLRFDVVAIKALEGGNTVPALMRMSPGRFDSAVQAGLLVRQALLKPDYQII